MTDAKPRISYDVHAIFPRRLDFVVAYQQLAMFAIANTPSEFQGRMDHLDFPSFTGPSSISIIEAISHGNLEYLALMATEFKLIATLCGLPGLIDVAPLIVTPTNMVIRPEPESEPELQKPVSNKRRRK